MSTLPTAFPPALRALTRRLDGRPLVWALTGSTGMALQGMPLTPADIDVQTSAAGAYLIQTLFADSIVRRVRLTGKETTRSHFGELRVAGVKVEVMGAVQKRTAAGAWEPPTDVTAVRRFVVWENLRLPVMDLAYEADAYRQMGRHERARLIEQFLRGA